MVAAVVSSAIFSRWRLRRRFRLGIVVHRAETNPEHGMRTFARMTFHSTITNTERAPMKPTPVKATPTKLTPPRQTPIKPERT
jgi:hypothetical protein